MKQLENRLRRIIHDRDIIIRFVWKQEIFEIKELDIDKSKDIINFLHMRYPEIDMNVFL